MRTVTLEWWAGVALTAAATAQAVTSTAVDPLVTLGPVAYDSDRERPVMLRPLVMVPPLFATQRCDLATWNGRDWVSIEPPITLPMVARSLHHDPVNRRLVAFDGASTLRLIDGQEIGFAPWIPTSLANPIANRVLVHDAARDELVAYGGTTTTPGPVPVYVFQAEMWVLRQGAWTQQVVVNGPGPRAGGAFVYDALRQRSVLFGGTNGAPLADTWEWDGVGWTQVNVTGPAAGSAVGTYDTASGQVVVRDRVGDLWGFDGLAWSPLGGTPPIFIDSVLVDDGSSLLLVGGTSPGYPPRYEQATYQLQAGVWQRVPSSVHMTPQLSSVKMVYDSWRRELLCLQGNPNLSWPVSTWTWDGTWRERAGTSPGWGLLAFDSTRGEAVVFGGATGGQTWTWNGQNWSQRFPASSPPATPSGVVWPIADDPIRQRVVLVAPSGTWTWDGITWSAASGPQPPPSWGMAWDPLRAVIVLPGPIGGPTWEWNGQWQPIAASNGLPFFRCLAFDPVRGAVFAYDDAATEHRWNGAIWQSSPVPVPMEVQYGCAMATDIDRGRVLFRGTIAPVQGAQLHVLGPTPSVVEDLGGGCAGGPMLVVEHRPAVGNQCEFQSRVDPAGIGVFAFSPQPGTWTFGSCVLRVDASLGLAWQVPPPSGSLRLPLQIPANPTLRGFTFCAQTATAVAGTVELSRAVRLRVGD